jgi:hypothetical protein
MRTYADSPVCPDCGQIPQRYEFDSRWLCKCEGRTWPALHSVRGNSEEHNKLTNARFIMRSDSLGDVRYCYPSTSNPKVIIWLYDNNTWRSEPEATDRDLYSYLEQLGVAVV